MMRVIYRRGDALEKRRKLMEAWAAYCAPRTTGKVIGSLHSRHRAIEFRKFLATIDREVPAGLEVHVVLDNVSTHKTPAIKAASRRSRSTCQYESG